MKTIDLATEQITLADLLALTRQESVLLLTPGGQEFLLAEADDFDREVAALRASEAFQRFLDERSASNAKRRIPLDEIEAEIEQELATQNRD